MIANTDQLSCLLRVMQIYQQRKYKREQQAVSVGPVAQGLERVRAKATGGHDVIEIDRGAADEGERPVENSFVAAQHDWQDHEEADAPCMKTAPTAESVGC